MTYIRSNVSRKELKLKNVLKKLNVLDSLGSLSVEELPVLSPSDEGVLAFIKDTRKYATWNGSDWTYLDGSFVISNHLTFTANEDGSSVGFIVFNDGYDIPEDYTKPSLQYSTDGGNTWQDYDLQISDDAYKAAQYWSARAAYIQAIPQ